MSDKSYELVWSHWLILPNKPKGKGKDILFEAQQCKYPNSSNKVMRMLTKKEEPKKTWNLFDVKIRKIIGKFMHIYQSKIIAN